MSRYRKAIRKRKLAQHNKKPAVTPADPDEQAQKNKRRRDARQKYEKMDVVMGDTGERRVSECDYFLNRDTGKVYRMNKRPEFKAAEAGTNLYLAELFTKAFMEAQQQVKIKPASKSSHQVCR